MASGHGYQPNVLIRAEHCANVRQLARTPTRCMGSTSGGSRRPGAAASTPCQLLWDPVHSGVCQHKRRATAGSSSAVGWACARSRGEQQRLGCRFRGRCGSGAARGGMGWAPRAPASFCHRVWAEYLIQNPVRRLPAAGLLERARAPTPPADRRPTQTRPAAAAAMAKGAQPAQKDRKRVWSRAEVEQLIASGNHVYLFRGGVYDVNVDEIMHPGGRQVRGRPPSPPAAVAQGPTILSAAATPAARCAPDCLGGLGMYMCSLRHRPRGSGNPLRSAPPDGGWPAAAAAAAAAACCCCC